MGDCIAGVHGLIAGAGLGALLIATVHVRFLGSTTAVCTEVEAAVGVRGTAGGVGSGVRGEWGDGVRGTGRWDSHVIG